MSLIRYKVNTCIIQSIEEFKLKYDGSDKFIRDNNLSPEVLEYYIENYKVNWHNISAYQTLSESFIDKYIDKVWWYCISRYQTLSESFMDKYIDKVDWYIISVYQPLSESFIETHIDKMDWYGLFNNENIKLSYEFILKHVYDFNLYDVSDKENEFILIDMKYKPIVNRLIKDFPDKYQLDKVSYEFNNNN